MEGRWSCGVSGVFTRAAAEPDRDAIPGPARSSRLQPERRRFSGQARPCGKSWDPWSVINAGESGSASCRIRPAGCSEPHALATRPPVHDTLPHLRVDRPRNPQASCAQDLARRPRMARQRNRARCCLTRFGTHEPTGRGVGILTPPPRDQEMARRVFGLSEHRKAGKDDNASF